MVVAIELENVSKSFKIYNEKNTTLKEKILYFGRSRFAEFDALNNISMKIEDGKTVGLIGRNGSGKSTLLKLLTRIIYPTSGNIKINGKVSSLLELGAGFHPDFTGRENIYMNASILGFSKKEIEERLDDIIAFSELEEFIDNNVRSYSTGMYMRLGFSVAIMVNPDILLIDEVLAVGDALFQKKCFEKLNDMKKKGKTIVFVSHDHGAVEKLCDEVIWVHEGKIRSIGKPKETINKYLRFLNEEENNKLLRDAEKSAPVLSENKHLKELEINNITFLDHQMNNRNSFNTGEALNIQTSYSTNEHVNSIAFAINIFNADGILCFGTNTENDGIKDLVFRESGSFIFKIPEIILLNGKYNVEITAYKTGIGLMIDNLKSPEFQVNSYENEEGLFKINHEWDLKNIGEERLSSGTRS